MREREATIEFLRWMVEQYSPSHHDRVFARSLAERLERRGWRASVDEVGNTIASLGDSDWNTVAGVWQVPTVAYGPGDSAPDHASRAHQA